MLWVGGVTQTSEHRRELRVFFARSHRVFFFLQRYVFFFCLFLLYSSVLFISLAQTAPREKFRRSRRTDFLVRPHLSSSSSHWLESSREGILGIRMVQMRMLPIFCIKHRADEQDISSNHRAEKYFGVRIVEVQMPIIFSSLAFLLSVLFA